MAKSAAFLMDAAGPLSVLISQAMHAGKPFLPDMGAYPALTRLMEDRDESQAFAAYLRGENIR
jgi:hypothetical protein